MKPLRPGRREYRIGFLLVALLFAAALVFPAGAVLVRAFEEGGVWTLEHWTKLLQVPDFWPMMGRSFLSAGVSALISSTLAFFAAYGLRFSTIPQRMKRAVELMMLLPLFLPSITYGFAVIYAFGRMGLATGLIGRLPFTIYGPAGLVFTNVLYTLPPAFLVISNAMRYADLRWAMVSRVMGDSPLRTFWATAVRPSAGAVIAAFILAFFLAFTDFGIPISIAGSWSVIATELYSAMMGAAPDFGLGAALAVVMLIPSAAAVWLLKRAEKLNYEAGVPSGEPPRPNRIRDLLITLYYALLALFMILAFAVVFVIPFVESWPYRPEFTMRHVEGLLRDPDVWSLYGRTIAMALLSAAFGTAVSFAAAMIRARSELPTPCRTLMDGFAMATSTLPGMVLGVGYLLAFSGTPLANTLAVLVLCNLVHFLATPYIMATSALSKMNSGWETTGVLMGDTWFKTVRRVILPNARTTLVQMFETYFINSTVTISAIVFLTSASTEVITTKIRELQHFESVDRIFVLSLLIFFTNAAAKVLFDRLQKTSGENA